MSAVCSYLYCLDQIVPNLKDWYEFYFLSFISKQNSSRKKCGNIFLRVCPVMLASTIQIFSHSQWHSPPALLSPSVTTLPAGHFAAQLPGSATDSESARCSSAAAAPPEWKWWWILAPRPHSWNQEEGCLAAASARSPAAWTCLGIPGTGTLEDWKKRWELPSFSLNNLAPVVPPGSVIGPVLFQIYRLFVWCSVRLYQDSLQKANFASSGISGTSTFNFKRYYLSRSLKQSIGHP